MKQWFFILLAFTFLQSCERDEPMPETERPLLFIPPGFPTFEFEKGNEFTQERWKLGKKLFYDPIMSIDSSVACSNCHLPEFAFSDIEAVSKGVNGALGTRNSPTLANVVYHPYYTREGGVATLEGQILIPIQEHNEFNYNIVLIAQKLQENPEYVQMSLDAYERLPDPFVITRSISTFERSMISGESPFDEFQFQNNTDALNASERRGMDLFFSDVTRCGGCHNGFNLTNYAFENNGLYDEYPDNGRMRLTNNPNDEALFKVPTLRNIEVTAPYMHDGSINTLEQVIEHYNSGGSSFFNKSDLIQPLNLTETQKADLINFLNSLTDEAFLNDEKFRR